MKVLLATDGSADAQAAVEILGAWPMRPIDVAKVVTVIPNLPFLGAEFQAPQTERGGSLSTVAQQIATATATTVTAAGLHAEPMVLQGDPADQILDDAAEMGTALILLGAQGVGGVRRFLLGSVAQRVATHATCSVLVVRPPVRPLRMILVATDGSAGAQAAVDALLRIVQIQDVQSHVVLALPPMERTAYGTEPVTYHRLRAKLAAIRREDEAAAHDICKREAERLSAAGARATYAVVVGDAAAEIATAARQQGAELVVVGSRGRSALAQRLFGGVARAVMQESPCSVLVGR